VDRSNVHEDPAVDDQPVLAGRPDRHRREGDLLAVGAWLEELGFAGELGGDPLPVALLTLAERVRGSATEANARVLGVTGRWIQLHASPISGGQPGRVAVIPQAATPPSIAPLISAAYGLAARERELIELVLQGCGTGEIAARLFISPHTVQGAPEVISPHTVQGHLKSIFARACVRSRRELVTRVFVRHDRSSPLGPGSRSPGPARAEG
jgi:DNA-binding CsgD family transcriptional regulator